MPANITGSVKISVTASAQTYISTDNFDVMIPAISNVFPLSGTFNDEVTILGQNFIADISLTSVTFSGRAASIVSLTESKIVVRVPTSMKYYPCALIVTTGSTILTSGDKFVLNPPIISTVTPTVFFNGQDIRITGDNFNPVPSSFESCYFKWSYNGN